MSYSPIIGFDAIISVNDGVANAQQSFTTPVMITPPDAEVSIIDASHMNMSSRVREKITGLLEPGSFGFEGLFNTADYARLIALKGVKKTWIIEAADTGEGGGVQQW